MTQKIHIQTPNQRRSVEFLCEPHQSLLEVLRMELGLTGTKEACNNGNCGACNVIMDGVLVNSCLVLAVEAQGKSITTIEGIALPGGLHPCRPAFWNRPPCSAGSAPPVSSSRPKPCWTRTPTPAEQKSGFGWRATCAAAPATIRSCAPYRLPRKRCRPRPAVRQP